MDQTINISERAQKLLRLLVAYYIREGQPVGSKTLANEIDVVMSSATIRNIMADLEDAGFLVAPYTSAGRVPTVRGYRFFVDGLLNAQSFNEIAINDLDVSLPQCSNTNELVAAASEMLSGMTKLAGLVMLPKCDAVIFRHAEFLPLSGNRVLVILVLNKQEVQNRIIYTDRCYTASELQQVGNYLTANFAGKDLAQVRQELFVSLQQERDRVENLTQNILTVLDQALDTQGNADYVVAGEANLLGLAEHSNLNKLRDLFDAFSQKREILRLLDQCLSVDGIKIYIGEESGYKALDDCSVVTAPYRKNGKVVGVLGVIGPTRMPYATAIAAVDVTAKLLSTFLEM